MMSGHWVLALLVVPDAFRPGLPQVRSMASAASAASGKADGIWRRHPRDIDSTARLNYRLDSTRWKGVRRAHQPAPCTKAERAATFPKHGGGNRPLSATAKSP